MKFAFIHAEKASFSVSALCRVLGVSRQGYYAYTKRPPSDREVNDAELQADVRRLFDESSGRYGSPRIYRALRDQDVPVSKRRVERAMRSQGLCASRSRRFVATTRPNPAHPVERNVLARDFQATRPNERWVTDITYIWTAEGWCYLAAILDLFSRSVVGWALSASLSTDLPLAALEMAVKRRRPGPGLLHHSDRGCQYTSSEYRAELARLGITVSMSRKGNCWDNAVAESFFATLKKELVHGRSWPTRLAVREAVFEYIEAFYNRRRLHSALDYRTPAQVEDLYAAQAGYAFGPIRLGIFDARRPRSSRHLDALRAEWRQASYVAARAVVPVVDRAVALADVLRRAWCVRFGDPRLNAKFPRLLAAANKGLRLASGTRSAGRMLVSPRWVRDIRRNRVDGKVPHEPTPTKLHDSFCPSDSCARPMHSWARFRSKSKSNTACRWSTHNGLRQSVLVSADKIVSVLLERGPQQPSDGLQLRATWGNVPPIEIAFDAAQLHRLGATHSRACEPRRTLLSVAQAGEDLGGLVGLDQTTRGLLDARERVELRAGKGDEAFLTDIVWEMATPVDGTTARSWDEQFTIGLGNTPVVRVVSGANPAATLPDSRPIMLWCISNEPHQSRQLDLAGFVDVFHRFSQRWSEVCPELRKTPEGRITWPELRAAIEDRRPTVLVLIAHGSSSPAKTIPNVAGLPDEPCVFFRAPQTKAGRWTPIRQVAECVGQCRSTALVILVCCDLTRGQDGLAGRTGTAYSAALTMVHAGASEVVAMQAPMNADAAGDFLHGFMAAWSQHFRTASAAAAGRRAVVEGREPGYAWLPTVFSAESSLGSHDLADVVLRIRDTARMLSVSSLSRAPVRPWRRADLAQKLARELESPGLLHVASQVGTSAAPLLAGALQEYLRGSGRRPALYLDCSAPGPDTSVAERVVRWFYGVQRDNSILFPPSVGTYAGAPLGSIGSTSSESQACSFAQAVIDADVCVLLDGVPSRTDPDDAAFWHRVTACMNAASKGLIVLAGSVSSFTPSHHRRVVVPNVQADELLHLLQDEAPGLASHADRILEYTDGVPTLIDELLGVYSHQGLDSALAFLVAPRVSHAERLLSILSDGSKKLLFRLACGDGAVPLTGAAPHLLWDVSEGDRLACLEAGAVFENRIDEVVWWSIAPSLVGGLKAAFEEQIDEAADAILEHWSPPNAADDAKIDTLLASVGGFEVAVRVAECHSRREEEDAALYIAGRLLRANVSINQRLRFARRASSWAARADSVHAGIHLAAAELALWAGRHDEAEAFARCVPPDADLDVRVGAKLLTARHLKDAWQHAGLDDARASLAEAISLIEEAKESDNGSEHLNRYLWEIRYEQLRLRLFFGEQRVLEDDGLIAAAPSAADRALVLATLAEAGMKDQPTHWGKVAEWAADAYSLACDETVECADRSYCAYQYARYLERRCADPLEAIPVYAAAKRFADEQEDPPRSGLAIYRRIALLLRLNGGVAEGNRQDYLNEVRDALDALEDDTSGILAARVRVRLHHLAAEMWSNAQTADQGLTALEHAVRCSLLPTLRAQTDVELLLGLLARFLEVAQEMPQTFRRQQQLLAPARVAVRERMEALGQHPIQLSLDDPHDTLRAIQEYLATTRSNAEKGRDHG